MSKWPYTPPCGMASTPDHLAADGLWFIIPINNDLSARIPVCEEHAAGLELAYHHEPIKTDEYRGEQLVGKITHDPAATYA